MLNANTFDMTYANIVFGNCCESPEERAQFLAECTQEMRRGLPESECVSARAGSVIVTLDVLPTNTTESEVICDFNVKLVFIILKRLAVYVTSPFIFIIEWLKKICSWDERNLLVPKKYFTLRAHIII